MNMSRRSFMVTAGAATLGMTALTGAAFADEPAWDEEADLVVIGIGAAGLGAVKHACIDCGASVIALEKRTEELAGGATSCFAGWVAGPTSGEAFHNMSNGRFTPEFAAHVLENYEMLPTWLLENTDTEMTVLEGEEGNSYMIGDGSLIWKNLYASLKDAPGLTLHFESVPTQLVKNAEGEVVGVMADVAGVPTAIKATKGVIVATGSYTANKDMFHQANFVNLPYEPAGDPQLLGDGIKLVLQAGGQREINANNAWEFFGWAMAKPSEEIGAGMMLNDTVSNGDPEMFTRVFINGSGNRFVAEDATFMHNHNPLPFIYDWTKSGSHAIHFNNLPMWCVYDSKVVDSHKLWIQEDGSKNWTYAKAKGLYEWSEGNVEEIEKGWILKADTLEELADQMVAKHVDGVEFQVDKDQFVATMAHYNDMCAAGEDVDFGKDSTCMVALDTPPFYAVETVPLVGYVYCGVVSDLEHRCLDAFDNPIPGLYAAGDVSSMGAQNMPATGVAQSFVFGYDSADHALNR